MKIISETVDIFSRITNKAIYYFGPVKLYWNLKLACLIPKTLYINYMVSKN